MLVLSPQRLTVLVLIIEPFGCMKTLRCPIRESDRDRPLYSHIPSQIPATQRADQDGMIQSVEHEHRFTERFTEQEC